MTIEEILRAENEKLKKTINASEKSNILFNIIKLKTKDTKSNEIYSDIKKFIDAYVESIKLADYGYDNFNYAKINRLIGLLPANQQISIVQYITSVTARELPDYERTWFIQRKHSAEIKHICESKKYILYPKTILLYLGQSIIRLLLGLLILFILALLFLLPAPTESMAVFKVTFENYSQLTLLNHTMNVLALFADLDNNIRIEPINLFGLFLIISGKIIFLVVIVNFIYYKIADKIAQK